MGNDPGSQNVKPGIAASDVAAGGGAGGALVYAINTYVVDQKLQTLLIYLVPTISIVFMEVYSFFAKLSGDAWKHYEAERTRKNLLSKARAALSDAKEQLALIENDGNATQDHKTKARDRVQKIETAVLELNVKGIVVID
jgi:hypothetical protein